MWTVCSEKMRESSDLLHLNPLGGSLSPESCLSSATSGMSPITWGVYEHLFCWGSPSMSFTQDADSCITPHSTPSHASQSHPSHPPPAPGALRFM